MKRKHASFCFHGLSYALDLEPNVSCKQHLDKGSLFNYTTIAVTSTPLYILIHTSTIDTCRMYKLGNPRMYKWADLRMYTHVLVHWMYLALSSCLLLLRTANASGAHCEEQQHDGCNGHHGAVRMSCWKQNVVNDDTLMITRENAQRHTHKFSKINTSLNTILFKSIAHSANYSKSTLIPTSYTSPARPPYIHKQN